jgi:ATP-dependent Clp protease adaptor protein ClpS
MSAQVDTVEKTKITFKRPNKWDVIIHNDNITPMNFVVDVLQEIFGHDDGTATMIMLHVHTHDCAVAGTYIKEIAETKLAYVNRINKAAGYTLKVTMKEL